jgi:hypothetical protein
VVGVRVTLAQAVHGPHQLAVIHRLHKMVHVYACDTA